ncbi:MAG: large-conductance mechanosensitive channel protein MscL [Bacteroidales bacterium]|jgi:large conductance mechanosensitive channel|nr:large-conductance mechanosensitive channel protein MscL [Bacteroidales bacterium]MBQ2222357.1 large-conductance mechanosensitive channel protein MscL [Bacteroidales bacterium]MBQ2331419.1 large-conductance mechanosensitive channel protein MscL [Bacteroidales bacterium]MBQ2515399.1 large-conductance mechanosensitive channel protein MscL [Bacteroidales bacterium]MBQ7610287.1 large-conductance mechanosensitive channel protein MscL [Bacteroidales bacterium]
MKKFLQEFKEFAMKGNVMDMAVGVIIGGAFGKIVSSLVNDLLMPLVGALIGNVDFTTLSATLRQAVMDGETVVKPAVVLHYGNFIQVTVDFLIVAFCIFAVIKGINAMKKKEEPAPAEPEAPAPKPDDVVLLEEIRDLLKKQK